jgi:ABC-type iron transport system FetAB permease component
MDVHVSSWMPLEQLSAAGDAQYLSPLSVAFAALLILVQAATSFHFHLGLHWQLLLAAVRCVLQLSVLGYILVPIFNYGSVWPVLAYAGFMVVVSTMEAIGRPQRKYNVSYSKASCWSVTACQLHTPALELVQQQVDGVHMLCLRPAAPMQAV